MSADLMRALRDPFPAHDVEWRVQSSGKARRGPWVRVLAYITNRAIMERLDSVCGVAGWRNEFTYAPSGAVLCGLSIKIDNEWITKWDGANETDIEAAKGGISNAMKRAAVQWGIGRYLYNLEEGYATIVPIDDYSGEYLKANPQKHGEALRWRAPLLPAWALPGGSGEPEVRAPKAAPAAESARVAAATDRVKGAAGTLLLPGGKTSLGGFGGKRIGDVPSEKLVEIREYLEGKGGYQAVLDAIDITLDERTPALPGGSNDVHP